MLLLAPVHGAGFRERHQVRVVSGARFSLNRLRLLRLPAPSDREQGGLGSRPLLDGLSLGRLIRSRADLISLVKTKPLLCLEYASLDPER